MDNGLMPLGLTEQNGKVVVSSRDVARVFGKRHDNVLKDVRELGISEGFRLLNFEESTYLNEQNHQQPEFLMTRDGLTILSMGYKGVEAMGFKEAYIMAFNRMEEQLRANKTPTTYLAALEELVKVEKERLVLTAENERLAAIETKYKGQSESVELYKIGEIAGELGTTAITLNRFLKAQRIQHQPNGSKTWRLYADYVNLNIAVPRRVELDNGREVVMLLWTPKGRDFICDIVERECPSWYV